jgi:hypothetical protein
MMKEEFEKLTGVRDISPTVYISSIEWLYMATDETKEAFVRRLFGCKNTKKSLCEKTVLEFIRLNRKALQGNSSATEQKLLHMDKMIRRQVEYEFFYTPKSEGGAA